MKKSLCLLLMITMIVGTFPFVVFASEEIIITTSDPLCKLEGTGWKESTNASVAGPTGGTSWHTLEQSDKATFDASALKGKYGVYAYITPFGATADKVDFTITASGKATTLVTNGFEGGSEGRHWKFLGIFEFGGKDGDSVVQQMHKAALATGSSSASGTGRIRASGVKFVKDDTNTEAVTVIDPADIVDVSEIPGVIITSSDSKKFIKNGKWSESTNKSVKGPLNGTSWYTSDKEASCFYDASGLEEGNYGVYVFVTHYATTADRVDVTITASDKSTTYITEGNRGSMGTREWIYLGKHYFDGSANDGVTQKINPRSSYGVMRTSGVRFVKDDENTAEPDILIINEKMMETIEVPEKGSVIVGTDYTSFTKEGSWLSGNVQLPTRDPSYCAENVGDSATWNLKINKINDVELFYFKSATGEKEDTALEIEVYANGVLNNVTIDCSKTPVEWVSLGKYDFSGDGTEYVKVIKKTENLNSRATCLKFSKTDTKELKLDKDSAFFDTDLHILERMGMLIGEGDGITEDYLKKIPTRVQAAIMVLRLNGVDADAAAFAGEDNFADADKEAWAKPFLAYLKAHPEFGLIGTGGNMFEPTANIDEQAYAKILLTALGYEYNVDFTWDGTLKFAAEKGISKSESGAFTVKDLAVMTESILDLNCKDGTPYLTNLILKRDGVKDEGVYGTELPQELKTARETLKKSKTGIIYNNDGNDVYKAYDNYPGPFDVSGLDATTINDENFLAKRSTGLEDTQVSLVTYCTGVFNSYTHESTGITDVRTRDWSRVLKEYTGKDSLETMVDYVHSTGREILWSMRMNDNHDFAYDEEYLEPWKQSNMDLLMYRKAESFLLSYSRNGWSTVNYGLMPVRQVVYDILKDTITRYDIDGLELDFSRTPIFFKEVTQGYAVYPENVERMNNLVRMIRDLTEKISIERNKPMLLAIYVPDSIELCKAVGLDVETWLKEDLVDIVSIRTNVGALKSWEEGIGEYKDYDVQVFAALDSAVYTSKDDSFPIDKNEAALAYAAGADGIYTYNYFAINHERFDTLGSPETCGPVEEGYKSELKIYDGSLAVDTKKFVTIK